MDRMKEGKKKKENLHLTLHLRLRTRQTQWVLLLTELIETLSFQTLGKHSMELCVEPTNSPRQGLKMRVGHASQPSPDPRHIRSIRMKARWVQSPSRYGSFALHFSGKFWGEAEEHK